MAIASSIMQSELRVVANKRDFAQVPKMMDIATKAGTNAATKNFLKGANDRQKIMEQNIKKSTQASKQNDNELIKNTQRVAKRAATAASEATPKRPPPPRPGKADTAPMKAHRAEYVKSMNAMGAAYKKFTDNARKQGLKVPKSARGWGGREAGKFAQRGAEGRGEQIDSVRTLVSEQKRLLKGMDKEEKGYQDQMLILQHLERQQLDMMNIDRDKVRAEKKHAKIKKKIDDDLKATAREKKKTDIAEKQRLKINTRALKQAAEAVRGYANSVGNTLRNAFLIGSAAVGAFFYKMQPVVEQVMEFEKELMNAQSIFQVTRTELHELSDVVTEFGLQYGIAYDTAVKGLYQYASAGVSASEANEMLAHTLKLSMAVQGDHEALAKLTTQTIMGFSMEFSDAAEVTDKFAHAINKSLIEWDDLASSVKFALPFFISTGQSIDQLLGALQVLTNRALEAGIAGRGLRQALAEFTQHAEDNAAAFNKMGVSILDMAGNMRPLNEIAQQFKDLMGEGVNDMEIMMALMEDLNIRGATAFVHLVQNAEEFTAAVGDLQNAAGTATEMAEIQQQSLSMQIQRVKNALLAPFLLSDKIGEAGDTLNEFTLVIKELVDEFIGFFIIEDEFGNTLTQQGKDIKTFAVDAIKIAVDIIRDLKDVFLESGTGLKTFTNLLHMATIPMKVLLKILSFLGPRSIELLVWFKVMNTLLPINTILQWKLNTVQNANLITQLKDLAMGPKQVGKTQAVIAVKSQETVVLQANALSWRMTWLSMGLGIVGIGLIIGGIMSMSDPLKAITLVALGLAAAFAAMWIAGTAGAATPAIIAGVIGAAGAMTMAVRSASRGVSGMSVPTVPSVPNPAALGGIGNLVTGGISTAIPQLANAGSSVINIFGDIYDEQGFSRVLAQSLPGALRISSDGGSI